MLNVLLTTIQNWFKQSSQQDPYTTPSILKQPLELPGKRWPNFLFRQHNQAVELRLTIMKEFNYADFLQAYQTVCSFQTNKNNTVKTADMLSSLTSQENEIRKVLTVMDHYQKILPVNDFDPIVSPINSYINELIYLLAKQRHQLDDFIENAVGFRLHTVSTSLGTLLKNLSQESTDALVCQLEHMQNTLLLISCEMKGLIRYQTTYTQLNGVITILLDLIKAPSLIQSHELKQAVELCYHETGQDKSFLSNTLCTLLARLGNPNRGTTEPTERLALNLALHSNLDTKSNPFISQKKNSRCSEGGSIPFGLPACSQPSKKQSVTTPTSLFKRLWFWLPGNDDNRKPKHTVSPEANAMLVTSLRG